MRNEVEIELLEERKHYSEEAKYRYFLIRWATQDPENLKRMPLYTDGKITMEPHMFGWIAPKRREMFLRKDFALGPSLKYWGTGLSTESTAKDFSGHWPSLAGAGPHDAVLDYICRLTLERQILLCRTVAADLIYNIEVFGQYHQRDELELKVHELTSSLPQVMESYGFSDDWEGFSNACDRLGMPIGEYWLSVILRYGLWGHSHQDTITHIDWMPDSYLDLDQWTRGHPVPECEEGE